MSTYPVPVAQLGSQSSHFTYPRPFSESLLIIFMTVTVPGLQLTPRVKVISTVPVKSRSNNSM